MSGCISRILADSTDNHSTRGLLLGVTPELATQAVPADIDLTAVDTAQDMIEAVWPGNTPTRRVVRTNWLQLPESLTALDFALGDGCLVLLDYPEGYKKFGESLAHALKPGGKLILRLFIRPEKAEAITAIVDAVSQGLVANFHILKWRLAMALQGDTPETGVNLGELWDLFNGYFPSSEGLHRLTGWPIDEINTINTYKGSSATYCYPNISEVASALAPRFKLSATHYGSYPLAERCPTVVFEATQLT
jgi:SAM-dependent methyltransferase